MNETTFENALAGDRVYDLVYGWGTVANINEDKTFPLRVVFDEVDNTQTYLFTGNETHSRPQTLFWDEIPITAPPRPKRLVTKVLEEWKNIYATGTDTFPSEDSAKHFVGLKCIAVAVKMTGSYEVEE